MSCSRRHSAASGLARRSRSSRPSEVVFMHHSLHPVDRPRGRTTSPRWAATKERGWLDNWRRKSRVVLMISCRAHSCNEKLDLLTTEKETHAAAEADLERIFLAFR